jgi:hypothetical protein
MNGITLTNATDVQVDIDDIDATIDVELPKTRSRPIVDIGSSNDLSSKFLEEIFDSSTQTKQEDLTAKRRTFQSLREVYNECSKSNWDGYNAVAISKTTYNNAKKLIENIPRNIPTPEITPEPTGEIGLEWYRTKHFVFVISVGENNLITYAGTVGEGKPTHGTTYFDNSIPLSVIKNIEYLFELDIHN